MRLGLRSTESKGTVATIQGRMYCSCFSGTETLQALTGESGESLSEAPKESVAVATQELKLGKGRCFKGRWRKDGFP